jgi:hypothetical protein
MTTQIRFTGWKPGLRTITFAKLLRDKVPMPLGEAKRFVERILEGEQVTLTARSEADARGIVTLAREAGATCEQLDSTPATATLH